MTWIARISILAVLLAWPAGARAQVLDLTVLHVNDVYRIAPQGGRGGLAQLATLLHGERARATHHLSTFGGDLISPSVMSGATRGRQMIALFNELGIDAAGLGNHEFDFGPEVLGRRLAQSKFPWLASNVLGADAKPFGGTRDLMIIRRGGLAIGFFALLTPGTAETSSPGRAVTFRPVLGAARDAVGRLKKLGADLIIAITHLPIVRDRRLAREIPAIRVILGGHDHYPLAILEGGTLILKSGHDAHYLAIADLHIEKTISGGRTRLVLRPEWRFRSTAGVAPDQRIAKLVAGYQAALSGSLSQRVGRTASGLDSRAATIRMREAALGNLIADAMRLAVGAEIGLTNGGGIRGDRTYPAGSWLSRGDLLGELPFGNVTVKLAISGADLRAALENAVSRIGEMAGRFAQISGMSFSYDPAGVPGRRVLTVSVGGKGLEPARIYSLATNDYLARGGDGYASLKRARRLIDASDGRLMASQVIDYIAARGTVAPRVEGRIQAKKGPRR